MWQLFQDERNFFMNAANYMIQKFPFRDGVLKHASVADVNRQSVKFSSFLSIFLVKINFFQVYKYDQLWDFQFFLSW